MLAQELYHHLIKEGFKAFFSRITLEDKLGTAYEPYIFAALNSAKVTVALDSKPGYTNPETLVKIFARLKGIKIPACWHRNLINRVKQPEYRMKSALYTRRRSKSLCF